MNKGLYVFAFFLIIRVLYVIFSGFNTGELSSDCGWINMLSERALSGNFDFDLGRFIVSPFYNIFMAGHKFIFYEYWSIALVSSQLIISSLSGVYFYKLGKIIFNEKVALISTVIFGLFPLTLYWVHTFSAESIFQSLLIISIYFLVKCTNSKSYIDLTISALVFSIVFLTKSHILLFTPFLALYLFLNFSSRNKILFPLLFALICLLSTIPFGMYNLRIHEQYVLSSNGAKFHFYTGNSEFGYKSIVDVPSKKNEEFQHIKNFNMSYFNGVTHDEIMKKPHNQKQDEYFSLAQEWINQNPIKFIELKVYNLIFFLLPGVSYRHYPFYSWLFSFIVSLPIYLFGYIGLFRSIKFNFRKHFFSLGLFLSMIIYSVVWYVQNRFRVITIEPIYILYSGLIILSVAEKLKVYSKKHIKRIRAK